MLRVADSVQGREEFTHFDLMAVDDLANWEAIVSDPAVAGNVARWTKDWSRHGPDHPDPAENLKISFCRRYWG